MDKTQPTPSPRSRVKKRSSVPLFFFLLLLVCGGAAYYYFFHVAPRSEPGATSSQVESGQASIVASNPENSSDQRPLPAAAPKNDAASRQPESPGNSGTLTTSTDASGNSVPSPAQHQQFSSEAGDDSTSSPQVYDPANPFIDEIDGFYTHLDQQEYMKQFGLSMPSKVHFSELLQKLMDNPPTVSRETDDLFTLLKNTAHFFRVLGKDNIIILKGILDREKPYVESILKAFYFLIDHPQRLKEEYQLSMPFTSLYDYAGFFLNTMGGRLYLFRRDSTSRMAVSYYAILIIDKANNEGNSGHGIDLVPSIDFLIEEMETGGKKLTMREEYLDTLYDLKEKYN